MSRGIVTPEVQALAVKLLGREISRAELRLYPYIDYTVKNFNKYKFDHVNDEEVGILSNLQDEKRLLYTTDKIFITPEFYDVIQEILKLSYVDFEPIMIYHQEAAV